MAEALEQLAAGAGQGPEERRAGQRRAPGGACPNCEAVLQGPYCHGCGQNADTHQRSIRRLVVEAVEGMIGLEGRLARTLPALFLNPGKLARDYVEARLARHVPPFRTFLVALLLFVLAGEHVAHVMTQDNAGRAAAEAAQLATPQGRAAAAARRRTEAATHLRHSLEDAAGVRADVLKDKGGPPGRAQAIYDRLSRQAQLRYARAMVQADRVATGLPARTAEDFAAPSAPEKDWWKHRLQKAIDNPERYVSVLFGWGQRVAVLLLPLVGLSLALVYCRRREVFIYDHLLVAMSLLSFWFLLSAVGLLLPQPAMGWFFAAAVLWSEVNLFRTLRGAYGSSRLAAAVKTAVVSSLTVLVSLGLLFGLMVLAVAEI
ncbi:DUF3667 domain-containing protein [Phenylobacterium sp.]|uniref:DUF3667 domain-containing protein n=1 Tax=Phenylobacterium sp. TaxID=1871053 RepID=UPI0012109AAE|nr:DUF3667 domain-containing protein [Phenylobacterium sp.]THD51219.1 MAG: DUF3667 domain-containing protein [Phenylobacterium sp.]